MKFKIDDPLKWAWGGGVFLVALLIRLVGIGWGLPSSEQYASYHPDEPVNYAYSQQISPSKLDFTPGFYNYGTLYLTLSRIASDIALTYAPVPAPQESALPKEVLVYQAQVEARGHQAGRLISALSGAGIALLSFLLLYGRTHLLGSVLAGAAAGLAPGLVMHSRFQTVDVFAAFLILLSLYFASRLKEGDSPDRWILLSAAFAGLSAGAKYTGILALASLGIMVWFTVPKSQWLKQGAIAIGAAILAFVISTPGVLLETNIFLRDFLYEINHSADGHGLVFAGTSPGFIYHLANLGEALGLVMLVIGTAGLARAVYRKHHWAIALAVFAGLYFILIGRAEVKFLRYVFPLIPLLCVGAGWLAGQAHLNPDRRWRGLGALVIAAIAGFGGGGLIRTLNDTAAMSGPDPRTLAGEFLRKNVKERETIGLVSDPWFYTARLGPSAPMHVSTNLSELYPGASRLQARLNQLDAESNRRVLRWGVENPDSRVDWDPMLLSEGKPDWVVYSSFESDDLERLSRVRIEDKHKTSVERYSNFNKILLEEYTLLADNLYGLGGSSVHDMMYIRPRIWIWKRKETSSAPSTGTSTTSAPNAGPAPTP